MLQLIKADVLKQVNQLLMQTQLIWSMISFIIALQICPEGFLEPTIALNKATLPLLVKLANEGYQKALGEDKNFLAGLNVHKEYVTYKAVADIFGHEYVKADAIKKLIKWKKTSNSTKVVVIGGGVVGCSVAYHLAKFGWKDTILCRTLISERLGMQLD